MPPQAGIHDFYQKIKNNFKNQLFAVGSVPPLSVAHQYHPPPRPKN
jgi:hypothetical protein